MATTPLNAVTAAYNNASRLISDSAKVSTGSAAGSSTAPNFAQMIQDSMQSIIDTGKASDQLTLDFVNGKANVVDVVTAISKTELAMDSMVAVRDKVISAYEDIMKMPI